MPHNIYLLRGRRFFWGFRKIRVGQGTIIWSTHPMYVSPDIWSPPQEDFQKMKLGEVIRPFLKRSLPESRRLLLRPRRLLLPILQFDLGQMYPGLWWPAWTFDGGANLAGLKLTLNFLEVPPFHDRCDFWKTMKEIVSEKCKAIQFNICYPLPCKERKYS